MKTVVVTGSARGFGLELLKQFRKRNYNLVLCDLNKEIVEEAREIIANTKGRGQLIPLICDVTNENHMKRVINTIMRETGQIDIWINNAGINQPNKPLWELDTKTINKVIDVDLKGAILCTKLVMPIMIEQGFGQIYNVEGHGSNNNKILGLSLYGTAKRAITYYTEALAYEAQKMHTGVLIGKISPGIMVTNFLTTSLANNTEIELDEKTKKIYNILGDYPETIAKYMVKKIINNEDNNVKFIWLTKRRAAWRFLTYKFHKRDFFSQN